VFEWDGDNFQNLNETCSTLYGSSRVETSDPNGDGLLELILNQGIPIWSEYYEGLPWRKEKRTCVWDGQDFVLDKVELAPPEYRFQAIQDGDVVTSQNELDKALNLYEEAINNDELSSFSPEIRQNLRVNVDSQFGPIPSPSPTPYPGDLTEYPKLAAYAYYRIALLQLVQEKEIDARETYNTLQEKFSNDPYGRPYVEMATAFWEAYQSTYQMYDGCAAAIQYAAEHPEILVPLGNDYHGSQSHTYVPADVCPFR
jgi:tetratricopeptide (TPR) repeat protein